MRKLILIIFILIFINLFVGCSEKELDHFYPAKKEITIRVGEEFEIPAIKIKDNKGNDLSHLVESSHNVDNSTVGTYNIHYKFTGEGYSRTKTIKLKNGEKKYFEVKFDVTTKVNVVMNSILDVMDSSLAKLVAYTVSKPIDKITTKDLHSIKVLGGHNLGDVGIEDISGLNYMPNLVEVRLPSQQIKKIPPLYLENLQYLELDKNQLTDISGLESVNKKSHEIIMELSLNFNKLTNINGIQNKYISSLSGVGNNISDISALEEAYVLNLDLSDNNISNIYPIRLMMDDRSRLDSVHLLSNPIDLNDSKNRFTIEYLKAIKNLEFWYDK